MKVVIWSPISIIGHYRGQGKTSLAHWLSNQAVQRNLESTIGSNLLSFRQEGVRIELWDLAGAAPLSPISYQLAKNSDLILFCMAADSEFDSQALQQQWDNLLRMSPEWTEFEFVLTKSDQLSTMDLVDKNFRLQQEINHFIDRHALKPKSLVLCSYHQLRGKDQIDAILDQHLQAYKARQVTEPAINIPEVPVTPPPVEQNHTDRKDRSELLDTAMRAVSSLSAGLVSGAILNYMESSPSSQVLGAGTIGLLTGLKSFGFFALKTGLDWTMESEENEAEPLHWV